MALGRKPSPSLIEDRLILAAELELHSTQMVNFHQLVL